MEEKSMAYLSFPSEYDKYPHTDVPGFDNQAFLGKEAIINKLSGHLGGVTVFEIYPGCDVRHFYETIIAKLGFDRVFDMEKLRKQQADLDNLLEPFVTEDRVFGKMNDLVISDIYQQDEVNKLIETVRKATGNIAIYGFGASQIPYDHLVYVEITRWEIQLRFRRGMTNFTANNPDEDPLRKFKRGYFVEWRIADRIKQKHFMQSDFIINGDDLESYAMVSETAFEAGLDRIVNTPFRLIPYFDPGVWGGKWIEEVCKLEPTTNNYAWAFDGVPEENALCFSFGDVDFHFPAVDVVFFRPLELLGAHVYQKFGKEYPIRFDFLDTMQGGNLSLQVHPLPDYIQKTFGMNYTQDESYYILDSTPESSVYLGLKEGVDPESMINDLEKANRGEISFPDEKYINRFPAKKHDHFLIPAGTIHCSGKNTMVLEISSTPYIFTFKLWDWDRLGLDGLPRPVHINHGKEVIQYDRITPWVEKNLINRIEKISDIEEKTGLHELEFIETRRFTFAKRITVKTNNSFNQLNLVEGRGATITSPTGQFPPYEVHYAETFIVPENVKQFQIEPKYSGDKCKLIQAFVR